MTLVERAPNKANKKWREKTPSRPERLEGSGHEKVDVEVFCCGVGKTVYSKSSSKGQKIDGLKNHWASDPAPATHISDGASEALLMETRHTSDGASEKLVCSFFIPPFSSSGLCHISPAPSSLLSPGCCIFRSLFFRSLPRLLHFFFYWWSSTLYC